MHKIVLKMMIISIESSEINVFSESYVSPVLTTTLTVCRRNRGDPSSVYMVRYKYYKKTKSFWFGLEPSTYRSRYKCIPYNNRYVQNFIQIG